MPKCPRRVTMRHRGGISWSAGWRTVIVKNLPTRQRGIWPAKSAASFLSPLCHLQFIIERDFYTPTGSTECLNSLVNHLDGVIVMGFASCTSIISDFWLQRPPSFEAPESRFGHHAYVVQFCLRHSVSGLEDQSLNLARQLDRSDFGSEI